LTQNAIGLDVAIEDVSEKVAALALQGPTSGRLLEAVADADIRNLRYFRMTRGRIAGVPVDISRTGYTGDLGYEIWMPWDRAIAVWDALMSGGRPFDIHPAGMLALDVARVEAGLLLIEVDFFSSKKALIASQKYSPFEMGLGRLVPADKGPFVGRGALLDERRTGPARQIAGVEISWPAVEKLFEDQGLAPQISAAASRTPVPVYRNGRQVGRATTTTWSPVLKKLIALATLAAPHFAEGTALELEVTVEAVRHRVPATVVKTPFFNPPRKIATPPF
jgi:aminomethyltransferase